jgi:hypothetical protein
VKDLNWTDEFIALNPQRMDKSGLFKEEEEKESSDENKYKNKKITINKVIGGKGVKKACKNNKK